MRMYIHTYIHTYIHPCMHACMHAYIHTYIHTYIARYLHIYIYIILIIIIKLINIYIYIYVCMTRLCKPAGVSVCSAHRAFAGSTTEAHLKTLMPAGLCLPVTVTLPQGPAQDVLRPGSTRNGHHRTLERDQGFGSCHGCRACGSLETSAKRT